MTTVYRYVNHGMTTADSYYFHLHQAEKQNLRLAHNIHFGKMISMYMITQQLVQASFSPANELLSSGIFLGFLSKLR